MNKKILSFILIISILFGNFFLPSFAKKKKNDEASGYKGVLPEIEKMFEYKRDNIQTTPDKEIPFNEVDRFNFEKGPMDDNIFLDVIIKKQSPSNYINDLLKILPVLNFYRSSVASAVNIQQFNANVNNLDLYVQKLTKDYSGKSESHSDSYTALQKINYNGKVLGNLKYEANYYSKYQPILEKKYTPQYLKQQEELLLKEIDKTIFIIQTECDKGLYKN